MAGYFFIPDQCLPHDPAGWGRWLIGHYLEHKALITAAAGQSPSTPIPDYNLGFWSDAAGPLTSWLNNHNRVHVLLRTPGSLQGAGIDFSEVDLADDSQFMIWQLDHANEHAELRAYYGLS